MTEPCPIKRHKRVALQFSGGKDSLAVLHLLESWWPHLTVYWCNTGDAFPETVAQMKAVEALVPHFVCINSDQPKVISECGPPSDLVPAWSTVFGRTLEATSEFRVQHPFECCARNIWNPMEEVMKRLDVTLIIRGQREGEVRKGATRSGDILEGIEYWYPIESWSRARVLDFLAARGVALPPHYDEFDSSLDCMTCTGYLDQGKLAYVRRVHPEVAPVLRDRFAYIAHAISAPMRDLADSYKTLEA